MPVLRGEDILFGKTLSICFESSLIGYQPYALLHAPLEKRSNSAADIAHAGSLTAYTTIAGSLMDLLRDSKNVKSPTDSLRILGSRFYEFEKMSLMEFEEVLRPQLWNNLTRRIEALQHQVQSGPDAPSGWSDDIRLYMENLSAKLTTEGLRQSILARESHIPMRGRLALAKRLTARFGTLLQEWPALIAAASDLKSRGIMLGIPI